MKFYLVPVCVFLALQATAQSLPIVPEPQAIHWEQDTFFYSRNHNLEWTIPDQAARTPIGMTLLELLDVCSSDLFSTGTEPEKVSLQFILAENSQIEGGEEAYRLDINAENIQITANAMPGLLYGLHSLRQLLYSQQHLGFVRCCKIVDYPAFSFRGVMDDISRGPLSSLDFMKKQIRRFSELKINVFSFYIEHVVKTGSHPGFSPPDGITIAQFHELVAYASRYHVKIMGSFQSLGHFRSILSQPGFAHLGVSDRMLNPGDPSSLAFLQDIYDELIPVSNHNIFNINCDETYDLARGPRLQALADSIGEGGVYASHVIPLLEYVKSQDKRPGLWGDVLLQHQELFERLPRETVVFTWDYSARPNFDDLINPITDKGFDFIACPGVVNSYKLWPDLLEARTNIQVFARDAHEKGALGVLTTVWDDGGRHFFHTDWYGIAVAGNWSWNPTGADQASFERHFQEIYLPGAAPFSSLVDSLALLQETNRLSRLDNQLLAISYPGHGQAPVFIDTTEFSDILVRLLSIQSHLQEMQLNVDRAQRLAWDEDLNFWNFRIRELIESVRMPQYLLQISKVLEHGQHLPDRETLLNIIDIVQRNLALWKDLQNEFTELWYLENRGYWYTEAVKIYQDKIRTWQDLQDYLVHIARFGIDEVPESIRFNLNYDATSGTYFTYWLGAGPFHMDGNSDILYDYLQAESGEVSIRPGAIDYFLNQQGAYQGWNKIISSHPSTMRLNDFYEDPGQDLAYTSCRLESDRATSVRFELESQVPVMLYLNGIPIVRSDPNLSIYRGNLNLKAGRNFLLLKVAEAEGKPWAFSFRIPEVKIRTNKYKYYIE